MYLTKGSEYSAVRRVDKRNSWPVEMGQLRESLDAICPITRLRSLLPRPGFDFGTTEGNIKKQDTGRQPEKQSMLHFRNLIAIL